MENRSSQSLTKPNATSLPVTLSSDFGAHYPGVMRCVLAKRGIENIIDLTHELPRHAVRESAFWLKTIIPYAPAAVHCVVVDPGVGGDRKIAIARVGRHALVGPDNGVLWPVAAELPGNTDWFTFDHVQPESDTFHGRDVFCPLAAAIAHLGVEGCSVLPTVQPLSNPEKVIFPQPDTGQEHIEATILTTDAFGNAITNVHGRHVESEIGGEVTIAGESIPIRQRYGAVAIGERLLTVGSHGHLELAVNQGSGIDGFGLAVGDTVQIDLRKEPD